MRTFLAFSVAVVAVAVFAIPATAGAPTPYSSNSCTVLGDYEYCASEEGVMSYQSTASGNFYVDSHYIRTWTTRYLPTNTIMLTNDLKGSFGYLITDDGASLHVFHERDRSVVFNYGGVTCTTWHKFVSVDGQIRHSDDPIACTAE